jgi:preprotein translocase subunit SecD
MSFLELAKQVKQMQMDVLAKQFADVTRANLHQLLAIVLDNRAGHAVLEPLYRQVAIHRRRIGRLLGLPVECPLPPRKGETA